MVLSFKFWNDLKNTEICNWPKIVRKYNLTIQEIEKAGSLIKEGRMEEFRIRSLSNEFRLFGSRRYNEVIEKYSLSKSDIEAVKAELNPKVWGITI